MTADKTLKRTVFPQRGMDAWNRLDKAKMVLDKEVVQAKMILDKEVVQAKMVSDFKVAKYE